MKILGGQLNVNEGDIFNYNGVEYEVLYFADDKVTGKVLDGDTHITIPLTRLNKRAQWRKDPKQN